MHELSLALNIVKIAEKEARLAEAKKVTSVTLEIGDCAGINKEIFDFAWPIAIKNTILEHARKIIKPIHGKGHCRNCNQDFVLKKAYEPCPKCGSFAYDLLTGKEFRVKSIRIK